MTDPRFAIRSLMLVAVVALGSAWPGAARGGDGVVEINQTCAVTTGCFGGDTPGFPVVIDGSAGRSYRLTSDLILATPGALAISIQAARVSIDLNRFEVRGPTVCSGTPLVCSPDSPTGGSAIRATATGEFASLRDGTIAGFTGPGVNLQAGSLVENLLVVSNAGQGISVGAGSRVVGNRVSRNRSAGILAAEGAIVEGNIADHNGAGISADSGSMLTGNSVLDNQTVGLSAGMGSVVSGNAVHRNDIGISVESGATLIGNSATRNGSYGISLASGSLAAHNTARENGADGLTAGFDNSFAGNVSTANAHQGISLGTGTSYRENVFSGNPAGAIFGPGLDLGGNVCNGTTTCP